MTPKKNEARNTKKGSGNTSPRANYNSANIQTKGALLIPNTMDKDSPNNGKRKAAGLEEPIKVGSTSSGPSKEFLHSPNPFKTQCGNKGKSRKAQARAKPNLSLPTAPTKDISIFSISNSKFLSVVPLDGRNGGFQFLSNSSKEVGNIKRGQNHKDPIHKMGWFNPLLAKAWKFIFSLTELSVRTGMLALNDSAWNLIEQPWWVFKSDVQERGRTNVVVWKNMPRQSPTPILYKFAPTLSLTERRMLQSIPILISVMGNRNIVKIIQMLHLITEFNLHSIPREMMMGVLQHYVTLMLGRGFSREMMR